MPPIVSVATAVYNQKPHLPRRVESILNQTLQDWEWTIVDDCSTDGSYEELLRLTKHDPRVKVLRNEQNLHISKTNQRAIDAATGEFLYRTDGDDYCYPAFLERTAAMLKEDPGLAVVAVRCARMDSQDRGRAPWPRKPDWRKTGRAVFEANVSTYQFRSPSLLYRTQAVRDAGGFDALPLKTAQDWVLLLRVVMQGDMRYVDEPLTAYRYHEAMTSRSILDKYEIDQWMAEHFLPIDDSLTRAQAVWPDLDVDRLRREGYRVHAKRMLDNERELRAAGKSDRADAVLAAVKEKLGEIGEPLPTDQQKTSLKSRLMALAMDLVPRHKLPTPTVSPWKE